MQRKWKLYFLALFAISAANVFYYRQFFIELYMRYKLRDEHIVISLSTTPYRIDNIQETIKSILHQKAPVKAIYLNVPYVFKRDNLEYNIPNWLLEHSKITILRGEDYGPATKLLGTLANVKLPDNAIIITVDDDVIYPSNLVLQLAYKAKQNPDHAIGLIGAIPDYDAHKNIPEDSPLGLIKIKTPDATVSVLQGYAGVAYRRNFFDTSIFEIEKAPQECKNSDDIYISFYLAKHGIPRKVLKNKYISSCNVMWETALGTNANALQNLIPKPVDKHRVCLGYLIANDNQIVF